jgi:putative flippase GtrA
MARFNYFKILRIADLYSVSFIFYFCASVLSALTEWVSFVALLKTCGPVLAATLAFVIATGINLLVCHCFVFKSMRSFIDEALLLFIWSGAVFVINITVFLALIRLTATDVIIAKILGSCVGFVFNYAVRQFFIFSPLSRFAPISTFIRRMR